MTLYSTLARVAADWRSARTEARTRRIIASLPADVRKDIGWPDAADRDIRGHLRRAGAL
jgi:hypothetical protein